MTDLQYPTGRFVPDSTPTPETRQLHIERISRLPAKMKQAVAGLNEEQLNTPYREGGWTVRQVIHHVPDSHLNAYIRFKWALTEENPTIKAYEEGEWAKLKDSELTPVDVSLTLLESLHDRWGVLIRVADRAGFSAKVHSPSFRPARCGLAAATLQLAREPSFGAHYKFEGKNGLVRNFAPDPRR
jgi:DinB superfamily